MWFPQRHSLSRWTSLSPSACHHKTHGPVPTIPGPPLESLQFISAFHLLGSPKLNTIFWMWSNCCWVQRITTFFDLLAVLLLTQPRMLLAFITTRAHCWPVLSLLPTSTIRTSSTELLPSYNIRHKQQKVIQASPTQGWTQSWRGNAWYVFPSWASGWVVLLGAKDLGKYYSWRQHSVNCDMWFM